MRTRSQKLVADVAMSLKGCRDFDTGTWWSGWKNEHWPAKVLRRGFRFYGYDRDSRSLFALVEITKGSSFTYSTLAEFERKVKQVADHYPDRDDPHWGKLPLPTRGKFCTGYALRWRRVDTVNIPFRGRFPQLGWADLSSDPRYCGDVDTTDSYAEGDRKYQYHLTIERNAKLRARAKDFWRDKLGRVRCLACNFDFEHSYGIVGADFIEMHHTDPLASVRGRRHTKARDLIPLCSNCHSMVHHRVRQPITMSALKRMLLPAIAAMRTHKVSRTFSASGLTRALTLV